jgi:hypothetical protein
MRRFIAVALLLLALPPSSAQATFQQLGSGDPYVDAQTGLTYAIWKPTTTANLKLSEIKLLICTMKSEEWISATYGSKKKYLKIMESDSQARCSDPGVGKQVSNIKVGTAKAKVFAFCNQADHVAWDKCSVGDIAKVGGFVMWTAPKTKLLKSTTIEVIGMGLTYKDIILTARGLKAISR